MYMDDPTDRALAVCAGVGLALCGIGVFVSAWRSSRGYKAAMKESRSDQDLSSLENIVTDSLPTHK
jgi:hypothetical protein